MEFSKKYFFPVVSLRMKESIRIVDAFKMLVNEFSAYEINEYLIPVELNSYELMKEKRNEADGVNVPVQFNEKNKYFRMCHRIDSKYVTRS